MREAVQSEIRDLLSRRQCLAVAWANSRRRTQNDIADEIKGGIFIE